MHKAQLNKAINAKSTLIQYPIPQKKRSRHLGIGTIKNFTFPLREQQA